MAISYLICIRFLSGAPVGRVQMINSNILDSIIEILDYITPIVPIRLCRSVYFFVNAVPFRLSGLRCDTQCIISDTILIRREKKKL